MKNLFYLLPVLLTPFFFINTDNFYDKDTEVYDKDTEVYNKDTKSYDFPANEITGSKN